MITARPLRSTLYIPGSKPRALDKARGLPIDAIIFDLEDAVSVEEKSTARHVGGRFGGRQVWGADEDYPNKWPRHAMGG